jgi:hypothetical protein
LSSMLLFADSGTTPATPSKLQAASGWGRSR